jgi:hypothetical protein
MQLISLLLDAVYADPLTFARAICTYLKQCSKPEAIFVYRSAIPSVYGFYALQEHIGLAFHFFCSFVSIAPHEIGLQVLLPFYCSASTARFTESMVAGFGMAFCHDLRYDIKAFHPTIVARYGPMFVQAIEEAFCLLSRSHQFLLHFCMSTGYTAKEILNFFLRDFVLPQFLLYIRATPFQNHWRQLRQFARFVNADAGFCQPLFGLFQNSKSILEIPCGFSVFDIQYVQLLSTPADVHTVLNALQLIGAVPINVKPFLEGKSYFQNVDYGSFWLRVFPRKPAVPVGSLIWRKVVFNEALNSFEHTVPPDYERVWRKLLTFCNSTGEDPIVRLKRISSEDSLNYALEKALDDLEARAVTFEHYLVHSMYLRELVNWNAVVNEHLEKSFEPYAAAEILRELEDANPTKLSSFPTFVRLVSIAPELQFSIIVQRFLPVLLTKQHWEILKQMRSLWTADLVEARSSLALPEALKNVKIQRRLWQAIEHLKCINHVEFAQALRVMFQALLQIQALEKIEPKAMQFAIIYSDCQELPGYFLVINCLIVRQTFLKLFQKYENELFVWHSLEAALLRLISTNDKLMTLYLELQEQLMSIHYT